MQEEEQEAGGVETTHLATACRQVKLNFKDFNIDKIVNEETKEHV